MFSWMFLRPILISICFGWSLISKNILESALVIFQHGWSMLLNLPPSGVWMATFGDKPIPHSTQWSEAWLGCPLCQHQMHLVLWAHVGFTTRHPSNQKFLQQSLEKTNWWLNCFLIGHNRSLNVYCTCNKINHFNITLQDIILEYLYVNY